jgi:hypothetical protein
MRKVLKFAAIMAFVAGPRAETLVQLDYKWGFSPDASCTPGLLVEEPWRRFACLHPVEDFENYVARLDTQFADNPLCHGVMFIRFPWSGSGAKLTVDEGRAILIRLHWRFWFNGYKVGDDVQWWYLENPKKSTFDGIEKINEIATHVCSLIANRGGEIPP